MAEPLRQTHIQAPARPLRGEIASTSRGEGRRLPKLIPDRRYFHRVRTQLLGRFMCEDKQEYPCRIIDMSAGGLAVQAATSATMGERVVVYVDQIGRIEGVVSRVFPEGFAVKIIATDYKREKIVNQLTWLVNRSRLNMAEERTHERMTPKRPNTQLTLIDGSVLPCQVLDISLSGASVSINPRPQIGQPVVLGLTRGNVVRHHEHGIGIRFMDVQNPATIQRQFG